MIPFGQSTMTVTALEWSPDGNFIAVGRSDGRLNIFQLESDDSHFEQTVFPGDSVANLYWTDFEKDMGCIDPCYQELIQRERKEYISKQVLDKIPNTSSVLWLSSGSGWIRAFMHGRVPLLSLFESYPVSHLYFSRQGYLFYAFHSSSTRSITLQALSLDDSLQSWGGPFAWFAENVLQLDTSILHYQTSYQKILSTLKEIGQLVTEKWNVLKDMLKDYNEDVSHVREAFLSLINGQSLSVFTPYFVNHITLMGAERWKKQIQEKISQYLIPLMKQISIEIRQMLMRWSRLESFLQHQRKQRPDIFASIYDQSLEMKQRVVGLLYQWNEWKQCIFTYMERLVSFVDWFCYHARHFAQESGCMDGDSQSSSLPIKDVFKVILFLDINDTPEEWFSPTQEWMMSLDIDEWKEQWNDYYQKLESLKWNSLSHLVWTYSLVDVPPRWFLSSSQPITYRNERNAAIVIAYISPETQRVHCLWLKHNENRELSIHLSFAIPILEGSLYSILWYRDEYLLWCATTTEKENGAVSLWIGMNKISFDSQSDTLSMTHSCSIPLHELPQQVSISSSPSRNLFGIQLYSKRIVLLDTTETIS
ncbi:hypothetical protein Gasu2_28560 [Galdieria sulphuraria]|nr:hypothetical protein Gasu2_28560 [Galdieria sulphuraria]